MATTSGQVAIAAGSATSILTIGASAQTVTLSALGGGEAPVYIGPSGVTAATGFPLSDVPLTMQFAASAAIFAICANAATVNFVTSA